MSGLSLLVVTLRYPPYVAGGYELLTRDAVEALRARGHRVSVLAGRGEKLAGQADVLPWLVPGLDGEPDLFERSFRASNLERFRLHFLRFANYRAAARALRRTRADVLFFFNQGLVSLGPILAARHAGVPTLGYVSDPWPRNHWLLAWNEKDGADGKAGRLGLLSRLWRGFRDLVGLGPLLVCSEYLAGTLAADGLEELEVLHLGVPPDMEVLARASEPAARRPGERLRVVCTSSLWEGKGQDVLLRAAARAVRSGADLELALAATGGTDEYRALVRRLAAVEELAGRVRFLERLARAELSALLARSHVLALPSTWAEPFSLAVLEGLAHGLAVIASDAGGTPEVVEHRRDGWIVPAGDEEALARALLELERDEELRRDLGARGRERSRTLSHASFVDGLEGALARAHASHER